MTQQQKIVTLMCRDRAARWFFPYDFMPPRLTMGNQCFVGYEAAARMAELRGDYPDMIETLPDGKYKKSRIRFAEIRKWFPLLSKDLRQIVAKELNYYPYIPDNKPNHALIQPERLSEPPGTAETAQTTLLDVEPAKRQHTP